MPTIQTKVKLYKIGQWTIARLPEEESSKLSSRSQVMAEGTLNNMPIQVMLEPDGKWSHWIKITKKMQDDAGVKAGDTITLSLDPMKEWLEPEIPKDVQEALDGAPDVQPLWADVTTMARWEWLRWISATKNPDTRKKRIEVSFSKLRKGERRPCCFNRAMCTDPYVSKSGVLLDPPA